MADDNAKKLDAIEQKRAEKLAARKKAVEDKMAEERLKLGELEDEHGILGVDIDAVFSPKDGRMIVVKTPKPVVYQRFMRAVNSSKPLTAEQTTELVYACLVYPTKAEFESVVDAAPAMLTNAANACSRLAGTQQDDAAGK